MYNRNKNPLGFIMRFAPHFMTPLSQWPGENFLASGDKLKVPNVNGDGKSLAFNEWGFWILLFTAQKSSGDFQNFGVLPSGDESSV